MIGVYGYSDTASGLLGESHSGNGVVGYSNSGYAGYFNGDVSERLGRVTFP